MGKTILLTGATDGIGYETAKLLIKQKHTVLLHGRSSDKLTALKKEFSQNFGESANSSFETFKADLANMNDVLAMSAAINAKYNNVDVLINNAGVLKTAYPITDEGLDIRFVVNTLAPYLLTQKLLPLMDSTSRIINVSSAAQAAVNLDALAGNVTLSDMDAYSQSKLAITMWSRVMALELKDDGPIVVSVNPGSLLGSKMVKEGFCIEGHDLSIGAEILYKAAVSDEFIDSTGLYFDNDSKQFGPPHADALDDEKSKIVVEAIKKMLLKYM